MRVQVPPFLFYLPCYDNIDEQTLHLNASGLSARLPSLVAVK